MAQKTANMLMQEQFIKHLKNVIPSNISLVDDLADMLKISIDSAYRRLRCETELSIDETYKICQHYRLSIDSVFSNKGDTVTCNYIKLTDTSDNFEKYLNTILKQTQTVGNMEGAKITYAAEEIPIFHSFHSEKLSAFKLFYWQRSVLNNQEYQAKKFTWDVIPQSLLDITKEINKAYITIPSEEIWTSDTIHTTIKQVEYYFESGSFKDKAQCIEILENLKTMTTSVQLAAEREQKQSPNVKGTGSFQLYNSELVVGTNCIHINATGSKFSYITFNSLNSLTTANQSFCGEIDHWMKNLIKKSTLISGVSEKQRFQFFNGILKQIDTSIEKIKAY
jgi:hypothetical protein